MAQNLRLCAGLMAQLLRLTYLILGLNCTAVRRLSARRMFRFVRRGIGQTRREKLGPFAMAKQPFPVRNNCGIRVGLSFRSCLVNVMVLSFVVPIIRWYNMLDLLICIMTFLLAIAVFRVDRVIIIFVFVCLVLCRRLCTRVRSLTTLAALDNRFVAVCIRGLSLRIRV